MAGRERGGRRERKSHMQSLRATRLTGSRQKSWEEPNNTINRLWGHY